MNKPLVSVICLCYNQDRFVQEAIQSVFEQTYPAIQLIVLDDGSTDESVQRIKKSLVDRPACKFVTNERNQGYTKALNQALTFVSGEFVIDLAADDILLPSRIEEGVMAFEKAGIKYGKRA
jgi:glycosyltransferase involved in cell wall biosynthesis